MSSRRWGRLRALAGALAAAAVLAGCMSIPTSGPVTVGETVNSDPRDGVFQAILDGPRPGDSPIEVVRGFIRASVGFADDHRVARSFLAPSRRLAWSPDASVAVYPSQAALKVTDSSGPQPSATAAVQETTAPVRVIVTVRVPVSGTIDGSGRYTVAAPGISVTRKFGVSRSDGEWKIDSLNDGILVTSSDFAVTFRSFPVYFADPTGRYLVPDVRWLPGTREVTGTREVPTALVRALLEGPSPYLRGAVISGAPPGTQMAVAAVVVTDQVATVDLTPEVRLAKTRGRQLLLSQLRATLSLGAISGVQITVRRSPLDIPADQGPVGQAGDPAAAAADGGGLVQAQPLADPQVDGDPVVLDKNGAVARLISGVVTPVAGVGGLTVPGGSRPAMSADHSAYAVLNADRSRLLLQLPRAKVSALVRGTMLTGPSFDPWGWVWTSDANSPGWVSAARPDPGRIKVGAPWLKGMDVVSLRISREGARALVALRDHSGGAHLFVAGVVRDANGQPLSLTQPLGLMPDLRTVVDASWVDEDQVVVLGHRQGKDGEEPWVAQVGGVIKATAPVRGGESVSAANGSLGMTVGTASGTLTQTGKTWSKVSSARWAAFAG